MKLESPFEQLNHFAQTQILIEHRNLNGFSHKLSEHLKKILSFYFN